MEKEKPHDVRLYLGKLAVVKVSIERSFVASDDYFAGKNHLKMNESIRPHPIPLFS